MNRPTDQRYILQVIFDGDAWLTKFPSGFALKFSSKDEAETCARLVSRQLGRSELIVFSASGEIETREHFKPGDR